MLNKKLIREIEKLIIVHHHSYETPIKGVLWEEIFAKAVIKSGGTSDWKPDDSHSVGKDQSCSWGAFENTRISNKSGYYTISSGRLKISGSRTTSHTTLEEKIKHLSNKNEDLYLCLARSSLKKDKNYYIFCFDTNLLDYHNQDWIENYDKNNKLSGWKCECPQYKAWVKKSLSDQLWTDINLAACNITPIIIELLKLSQIYQNQLQKIVLFFLSA